MSEARIAFKIGDDEQVTKDLGSLDALLAASEAMQRLHDNVIELLARGLNVSIDTTVDGDVNEDGMVTYTIKLGKGLTHPKLEGGK